MFVFVLFVTKSELYLKIPYFEKKCFLPGNDRATTVNMEFYCLKIDFRDRVVFYTQDIEYLFF